MAAAEHNELAALSEIESLSDSDWLEVASSRESEDNDSILDESDAEPDRPFRSRASSMSAPSAPDVDRWEGFIEGVTDVSDSPQGTRPSSPPSPAPARAPTSPLARNVLATEEDLVEDERVRHALDQSMMSTLSSSRSSHVGSELRLSFPDPITSSHDELNRSFEDVAAPSESGDTAPPSDVEQTEYNNTMTSLPSTASTDIGSMSAPEVLGSQEKVDDLVREEPTSALKEPIEEKAEQQEKQISAPLSLVTPEDDSKVCGKPTKDHLPRLHVTTIVAVLSLAVGYMITGSMPNVLRATNQTVSVAPTPSAIPVEVSDSVNLTIPTAKSGLEMSESDVVALVASSMSDFALSIVKPTTSALAVRPSTDASLAPVASGSGTTTDVALTSCAYVGSSKRRESKSDVSASSAAPTVATSLLAVDAHASTSLSVVASTTASLEVQSPLTRAKRDVKGKGKAASVEPPTPSPSMGLSKHVFSNALDVHLRAIGAAIAGDLNDLVHALDELTQALIGAGATVSHHGLALGQAGIDRAKESIKRARELRGALHGTLREKVRGHHGRAKKNARALKAVGQRLFAGASSVSQQLLEGAKARVRGHTEVARRNAKMIRGERAAKKDRRARRALRQEKQAARRDVHNQRMGATVPV